MSFHLTTALHAQSRTTLILSKKKKNGWKLTTSEKQRLDDAATVLQSAYPHVHKKTCIRHLEGFCCDQFPENYDRFQAKIPELLDKLRLANEDNSNVFVLVSGVQLEMPRLKLGSVEFMQSCDPEITQLREKVPDIDGNFADPLPQDCVVGRYQADGDSEYSREVAIEQLQLALDILQFASAPLNPGTLAQHILSFGLYLGEQKEPASLKTWTYQEKMPSWHVYSGASKRPNNHLEKFGLRLTESCIEKLQTNGLSHLEEILPHRHLHPLEDG